jgi:hypothetical protein
LVFFAQTLTRAGYDVTLVACLDASVTDADHRDVLKFFLPAPFCRLLDWDDAASVSGAPYEFAIAGLHGASTAEEKEKISALIAATPLRAVVLRRYDTRLPAVVRLMAKEVVRPFIRRARRVVVEEYRRASWCLGILAPISRLGIIPHHRVTCNGMPEGCDKRTERSYLFNFLGTYDADPTSERVPVIDRLESRFQLTGGAQELSLDGKSVRVVWHADRPGSTRARPLNQYLDTLGDSFFTLCMSGDTVTTHRVLEAIHCGSVPVLSEQWMQQYDLPLVHGDNCWLVRNGDWVAAISEISALDPEKIFAMQSAVKELARHAASIPSLERKYLAFLR